MLSEEAFKGKCAAPELRLPPLVTTPAVGCGVPARPSSCPSATARPGHGAACVRYPAPTHAVGPPRLAVLRSFREAACDWVRKNTATWEDWVRPDQGPDCPKSAGGEACSGHGSCAFVELLPASYTGTAVGYPQGVCTCDEGYSGEACVKDKEEQVDPPPPHLHSPTSNSSGSTRSSTFTCPPPSRSTTTSTSTTSTH